MITLRQPKRLLLASLVVAALTACGSSSDYVPGAVLSGVAATGAALANATVTVVCNAITGTGSVTSTGTTDGNGAYTITAANGKPVCLVTASKTTNGVTTTLNSIAVAEGVVNINPITNLVVAGLLVGKNASSPAQLVTAAYAPTASDVTTAQTAVVAQVNVLLVAKGQTPLAVGTDLISGAFAVGNAADKVMDTLVPAGIVTATNQPTPATLTAVTAAVDAVVATNPGTSTGATGGT
jgi:hypothetical protein